MLEYSFDDISRQIVDDYLRDIVFIDEKAYVNEDGEDSFDAEAVSQCFAKSGKLCTIYAPTKDVDIDLCTILAEKADVLVVDWRLSLEVTKELDENADAADDIRGEYTLQLLRTVLQDAGNDKFKLIVIYTGETDIEQIFENICIGLSEFLLEESSEELSLSSRNIEIVVRSKNSFVHKPEWNKFVIEYDNLPSALVEIFTKKIKGLLPNYALSAITEIRKHTPKILSVFSKDLDAAYLGHEVSIPNKEDAQKLLNMCFGSAVSELLQEVAIPMHEWYHAWIEEKVVEPYEVAYSKENKLTITQDFSKSLVEASGTKLQERINSILKGSSLSNRGEQFFIEKSSYLFGENEEDKQRKSNNGFARFTQVKNIFGHYTHAPLLTLGTVVKNTNTEQLLLCIQQSCDAARLPLKEDGEKGRDFLFLPIKTQGKGISIITNEGETFYVNVNSYAIKKIHFNPSRDGAPVFANSNDKGWEFVSNDSERFQWEFDIKESYALHIVNKYASQLTRVGIDIAECIRVKSE